MQLHIFGYGPRVRHDVYPAAIKAFNPGQIFVYTSSPKYINLGGEIHCTKTTDDFSCNADDIIIISVPPGVATSIVDLVLEFGPAKIFVDTPAVSELSGKRVCLMEDIVLSPFFSCWDYLDKICKLTVSLNAHYRYHGVALFGSLGRKPTKSFGPFTSFSQHIMNRRRNYEAAVVFGIFGWRLKHCSLHMDLLSGKVYVNDTEVERLTDEELRLCNLGDSNFEDDTRIKRVDLYKNFEAVKRVGLYRLFKKQLNSERPVYSARNGVADVMLSDEYDFR